MLESPKWYLLQCKAQQQARAEWHLAEQDLECYSPVYPKKRITKGKVEIRNEVLFPGYAFIKLNSHSNWAAVRSTRGVSRIVSFNGAPHPVPDELIAALKQRTAQGSTPAPLFKQGERVTITDGCFKHIDAIVKGVTADERIIVLLTLLQTEQTLKMSPAQLARAS